MKKKWIMRRKESLILNFNAEESFSRSVDALFSFISSPYIILFWVGAYFIIYGCLVIIQS